MHISRSKCGAQVCGANIELLIKEGCKQFVLPKTNTAFWQAKIDRNRERDQRNYDELMHAGWQVIIIWACHLAKDKLESTMQTVAVTLNKNLLNIL